MSVDEVYAPGNVKIKENCILQCLIELVFGCKSGPTDEEGGSNRASLLNRLKQDRLWNRFKQVRKPKTLKQGKQGEEPAQELSGKNVRWLTKT